MYFPPYSLISCDNQINSSFSVLQCIKKNGASFEHLELPRSSLLCMDPLRFCNVVSAASRLSTLVVRNICSDAMLKLIGANCNSLHPIRSTVRHIDITDTSITNVGLPQLGKKIQILNSIGEYSVSDSFLWSLCVVSSMKIDKFPLVTLHTRKVSYTGMYNLVRCTPSPWSAPSHAGSLCLTSGTWPTCPTSSR